MNNAADPRPAVGSTASFGGILADNIWETNTFNDSLREYTGNRARLNTGNHNPVAPIRLACCDEQYECLTGWVCLGWTTAPWASKTGCPTCIVFEKEDGQLLWAHCIPHIAILPNDQALSRLGRQWVDLNGKGFITEKRLKHLSTSR